MTDWWNVAVEFLQSPNATAALRAAIKIAVGIVLGRLAGRALVRIFAGDEDPHRAMLLRRAAFYGIAGLFTASASWSSASTSGACWARPAS